MSDFFQNGIISTLHDFGTKSTSSIETDLHKFSKERKMELILPCLYSELEGSALPNIVEEISKTKYLNHVIIGLDKAYKEIFSSKNLHDNLSKINGDYKDNELVGEVIRFIEKDKRRAICSPQK